MSDNETGNRGTKRVRLTPEDQYTHKLEATKWENRRRMAWWSLAAFFGVTGYLIWFASVERIASLGEVYTWLTGFCMSVVGSYIGFATYYDVKKNS